MNHARSIVSAAVAIVICVFTPGVIQASSERASMPFGLWVSEAPERANTISARVHFANDEWIAEIDGAIVSAVNDGDELSLAMPNGDRFSGSVDEHSGSISGFWFQPADELHYQSVVSPAELIRKGDGSWEGEIEVQARPYHVFLDIFDVGERRANAVIRNPEANNTFGAATFRVADKGDGVWILAAGRGPDAIRHQITASGDAELLMLSDRLDEPIRLRQASEADRSLYYSRVEHHTGSVSIAPEKTDDGWTVTPPQRAGLDADILQDLTDRLADSDPREQRPRMLHSLLISHRGELIFEKYFYGHDRDHRHDIRSLGKVFGSVLIGAMQQQGSDIAPDDRPVTSVLRESGRALGDPRKAAITLEHLLTFTSGLDCDENASSQGAEERMMSQSAEPDYFLYTASLDLLHDPGTRYAYCSGSANLVGASLREFGGAPVYQLFDDLIARPLAFGPYSWVLAPNGEGYLGGGAYMRPRDILKIGAMYADEGRWNGRQIIDRDWVEISTRPKVEISPSTTGMSEQDFGNTYFGGSQAYIWVEYEITSGGRTYRSYQASGNGGQLLIVVPELDLAVAMTGGNYRMGGVWGRWRDQIVGAYVIPAVVGQPSVE